MKDNPMFYDSIWVHLTVYLLLESDHIPQETMFEGNIITLLPGQVITSRGKLAETLRTSPSKIERVLTCMEIGQQIGQQKKAHSRLISMVNWEIYQGSGQQNKQLSDSHRTATGQPNAPTIVVNREEVKKLRSKEVVPNLKDTPIKPKSEVKVRVKLPPDPRIQIIIDYFQEVHLAKTGKKPLFLDKDFPLVKSMLRVASAEDIKKYIDKFFLDQDKFLCDKGKSLNTFCVFAFSRYHSKTKPMEDGEYGTNE